MAPAGRASSSVNSAASCAGFIGWLEASSAASTIRVIRFWSMLVRFLAMAAQLPVPGALAGSSSNSSGSAIASGTTPVASDLT